MKIKNLLKKIGLVGAMVIVFCSVFHLSVPDFYPERSLGVYINAINIDTNELIPGMTFTVVIDEWQRATLTTNDRGMIKTVVDYDPWSSHLWEYHLLKNPRLPVYYITPSGDRVYLDGLVQQGWCFQEHVITTYQQYEGRPSGVDFPVIVVDIYYRPGMCYIPGSVIV